MRRLIMVTRRATDAVSNVPVVIERGRSEWRRWRAWIIAGPILCGVCVGLLVFAAGVR